MKPNIQYVARVLSGVNMGAEALLPGSKPVVIGKSATSDIIFSGARVANRHIKIQRHGNAIELIPLAQPVYVDGKDVGLKSVILKPNQVVTIGDVRFAINDKQQPWPESEDKQPHSNVISEVGAQEKNKKTSKSLLGNPWVWLSLLALVAVNVHYFVKSSGGLPGILGFTQGVDQQASQIVGEAAFSNVKVSKTRNGITTLDGYVKTVKEKEMLNQRMQHLGSKVIDRVFIDQSLEDSANQIARTLGEGSVNFSTLQHGRLKATGIINERRRWISLRETIRSDVKGVLSINDDEIVDLSEQFLSLKRKVALQNFSKRIRVSRKKGLITVEGSLTPDEGETWTKLFGQFQEETSYEFRLVERFTRPSEQFEMAIRTASVGEVPFVVSKQGKKYFVGSNVGKGYFIEAINHDHIVLNNNEIKFPLFFGQKENKK
ncbi:MAG: Unknown protein [uncultured Thiotrichaceae bacterium]|uniref:EscD/YscD/HrpQ family type III secretion system inner membrane ring protein n=1 Tax=uncultured Thiotrichaceae bacterium TaxID=298394 RepID=A0A6S6T9I4_9GAMM|nr:MAG: Unknown protein [uncultured Thiotrichaceae bacterium]